MAQQYRLPDGTVVEQLPDGSFQEVVSGAGPSPATTITKRADPVQKMRDQLALENAQREAAAAPVKAERDRLALERDRLSLEKDRRATTTVPAGKPLREGDGDKLEKDVGTYSLLKGALGGFQPDYSGFGSGIENGAQAVFGTGTPGQRDWWAQVYQVDNAIRNGQFGASLTDGEKAAYASTTVTPNMRADEIQKNLTRRIEIIRGALGRKVNRLKAGGYNPAEIDAATGDYGADLAPGYKPPAKQDTSDKTTAFYGSAADNGGDTGGQMSVASGPSRSEADPVLKGVNAQVNGMLKSGRSDDEIVGYLKQVGANAAPASVAAALKFRRGNPGYKGNYSVNLEDRVVPQSAARQAFQGVGSGPLGSYAVSAADALTAGRLDNLSGALGGNSEQVNAAKELLAKANWKSSLAGNVTGGALAASGLELGLAGSGLATAGGIAGRLARAPLAADVGYGALLGSDDPNHPLLGAALGAGLGLAGGALGQGAAKAVGGVRNEAVQRLRERGVPLTLGQAVGQSGRIGAAIKNVEDLLTGIPFVGAFGNARRTEGLRAWNLANGVKAADGAAPVTAIGERGAEQLDQAVTNAYAPLNGYSAQVDAPLGADLQAAAARGQRIPGRADDFNYVVNERVAPNFENGVMSGRNYQDSVRGLRHAGANQGMAAAHPADFTGALGDVEAALTGMFARQAPETVPVLERANRIFRHQSVIDAATRAAKNVRDEGDAIYTPAQLNTASVQNATRYGGADAATTTQRPFYQEIADAQQVLPSRVADSGTAGRLALTGALAGGGGAVGYAGGDAQKGAAAGAMLALLQTRAMQKLLAGAVLKRSKGMVDASDWLIKNGVGSAIGGPIALQALPSGN